MKFIPVDLADTRELVMDFIRLDVDMISYGDGLDLCNSDYHIEITVSKSSYISGVKINSSLPVGVNISYLWR